MFTTPFLRGAAVASVFLALSLQGCTKSDFESGFLASDAKVGGNSTQVSGSNVVCSDEGEDCRDTRCCNDASHKCFQKNDNWAGCKASCEVGRIGHDGHSWACNDITTVPGTSPGTGPEPAPVTAPVDGSGIKFLNWNVHWQNQCTDCMADVLYHNGANNADIVGLCEFSSNMDNLVRSLNSKSPGRAYKVQSRGGGGYGTDIIFDSNLFEEIEGEKSSVSCPGTNGGNRAANTCVLREKATQRLLITGGIHLSSKDQQNCKECELGKFYEHVEEMRQKYPDAAVVYMGDMNRGPGSMRGATEGTVFGRQVFAVEDMSQANGPTSPYHSEEIDYIFAEKGKFTRIAGGLTGQFPEGDNWVGGPWSKGGDHAPITATLAWNA